MRRRVQCCIGSDAESDGVRVRVEPTYVGRDEAPTVFHRFAYRIAITNGSPRAVRLLSRRWLIVDADGERRTVEGEGVVGVQPVIPPGSTFVYESFCPLRTTWGTMEGRYLMQDDFGVLREVTIARFYLVAEPDDPDDAAALSDIDPGTDPSEADD